MTPSYIQKSNNIEIKGYTPRSFRLALAETCITCNEKTSRLMRPYDDQNAKTELAKFELLEDIAKANIYLYRIRLDTIVAVQFEAEHMPPNYLFVRWATRDWKQYIIALNDKLTMGNSLISSFKQHDDLMLASSSAWYAYARGEMNDDWHPFLKDMEPASLPNSSLSTQPEPEPVKPNEVLQALTIKLNDPTGKNDPRLDDIYRKMLAEIQKDFTISDTDLAYKVGLPDRQTTNKLRNELKSFGYKVRR